MPPVVCIFEDEEFSNFLPLAFTRPVYELRCGILTLREKIERRLEDCEISLHTRSYLKDILSRAASHRVNDFDELHGKEVILVNGRLIPDESFTNLLGSTSKGEVFESNGNLVIGKVEGEVFESHIDGELGHFQGRKLLEKLRGVRVKAFDGTLLRYPWELISRNSSEISSDFIALAKRGGIEGEVHSSSVLLGKERIFVGKGAKIEPMTVIDARSGPVWIGEDVIVSSFTRIEGPSCVLRGALLTGGKARQGTSIGQFCRVGGEVEETIFQGHSNKYHEGFLGHSYIGEWVNLGAMTTNSDLKNNYSPVKVWVNRTEVDTGVAKVGCFVGDHVKTGIGTLLNTGTVLGVGSNVFGGARMPPKFVPSFFWGGGEGGKSYEFSKFLETAEKVMSRRDVAMSDSYKNMLSTVYELTRVERKELS